MYFLRKMCEDLSIRCYNTQGIISIFSGENQKHLPVYDLLTHTSVKKVFKPLGTAEIIKKIRINTAGGQNLFRQDHIFYKGHKIPGKVSDILFGFEFAPDNRFY